MLDGASVGRFVWYELMTSNSARAEHFYTRLFGWRTLPWDHGDYTFWMRGEKPFGGLMRFPDDVRLAGSPPHWIGYITSPDLAVTVRRARELGGGVLRDITKVRDIGRFAILADPQGAVFAAYTPLRKEEPPPARAPIGQVSWHELVTTHRVEALSFYHALFGWQKMGESGTPAYAAFGRGAARFGGIADRPAGASGAPAWLFYVRVADARTTAESIVQLGGSVISGPDVVDGGDRVAQCQDPEGAAFAIHELAST